MAILDRLGIAIDIRLRFWLQYITHKKKRKEKRGENFESGIAFRSIWLGRKAIKRNLFIVWRSSIKTEKAFFFFLPRPRRSLMQKKENRH